ncbi:unnamed protein product [Closterium sp. Naga37s-1]|nr:unnamed protein product [Closterium sp. Naga37s-1]
MAAATAAANAAATAAVSTPVFVYGTLMADEVLRVLLDRVPASTPARLPNFTRHSIKGRQYPAVVPKAHDSVMGKVRRKGGGGRARGWGVGGGAGMMGRQYLAVVPKAHDSVMGKLLLNPSPREMSLYDAFEDVKYVRCTQPVPIPPPLLPLLPLLPQLLFSLSPPEMNLFDAFEDVEYVRSTHPVSLQRLITQPVTGQGLTRGEGASQAADQVEPLQAGEEASEALGGGGEGGGGEGGEGGEGEIEAFVYVWANAHDPDLYGSWDYEVRALLSWANTEVLYGSWEYNVRKEGGPLFLPVPLPVHLSSHHAQCGTKHITRSKFEIS